MSRPQPLTNPFQYTGRESDNETGLFYYRARFYDAPVGRFVSEDPNARSAAGAVGLLQVTPIMGAALQNYGLLTPGMSPDDEGHTYFNLLLSYCENVSYAIAAYNAGPTAVNRASGIPNNRETRNEVKRVDKCLKQQLHISDGLQHPNLAPVCGCQ